MKIGLLTGGGDAPGLNGIIEATSRCLLLQGLEVVGICDGFEGIFKKNIKPMSLLEMDGIHSQAGTYIGTSNRSGIEGREAEFISKYKELGLDGLVVAGGDGTFRCLEPVRDQVKIIGVPKTIDNDLPGTDATFGYDTACSVVSDAVDSVRATAVAHKRVIVVEVMGRTAGWIAVGGGIASYADAILIPEIPFDGESFKKFLLKKKEQTRGLVVVVAEGVTLEDSVERSKDKSGASVTVHDYGVGQRLVRWIEGNVGWESRSVVLGHLQRSRVPTTTDRFLTTAMGVKAAQLVLKQEWGSAVVFKNGRVVSDDLSVVMGAPRLVKPDHKWVRIGRAIGIHI